MRSASLPMLLRPVERGRMTANSSPPSRARKHSSGSATCRQPRHLLQHLVAGLVAERVVDFLEAVEIEQQQRAVGRRLDVGEDRLLEFVLEQRPVGEPGQRIVVGELFQLLLGALALGDVLDGALEADQLAVVVADRLADDREVDDRAVAAARLDVDALGTAGARNLGLRTQHACRAVVAIVCHDVFVAGLVGDRIAPQQRVRLRRPPQMACRRAGSSSRRSCRSSAPRPAVRSAASGAPPHWPDAACCFPRR